MRSEGPSRLPGPDRLGVWVGVALLVAIVLHAVAFLALGQIKVALGFQEAEEIRTAPINVDQVEVLPPAMDDLAAQPEPTVLPDAAALLDEIDILSQLPEDMELDITPDTIDPEFAITPQQPLPEGVPQSIELDASSDFDLLSELPEIGRTEQPLPIAAEGQVIIDPGEVTVADPSLDEFTAKILKQGAEGMAPAGSLDGVVTLDDLVGLPENVLVGKKTMLPSDLLFDYNSAELRESARVGLMKLALLVERNPNLFCWIEGYTDLYGGVAFNLDLSKRRAQAVKSYLVESLRLPNAKIATRGYGRSRPLVAEGSVEEQAPNRRVEIKMRRTEPPEDEPVFIQPKEPVLDDLPPAVPREPLEPVAPKAVAVPEPEPEPVIPKAVPIPEPAPRAIPVHEPVPRAVPVPEPIPRARPVPE
jgi:outer membrane protein OmpA-like peptidoglycan-associated protein